MLRLMLFLVLCIVDVIAEDIDDDFQTFSQHNLEEIIFLKKTSPVFDQHLLFNDSRFAIARPLGKFMNGDDKKKWLVADFQSLQVDLGEWQKNFIRSGSAFQMKIPVEGSDVRVGVFRRKVLGKESWSRPTQVGLEFTCSLD